MFVELSEEQLERNATTQVGVLRKVNLTHSTRTYARQDSIMRDDFVFR
jgi:hypothetical protein